MEGDRQADAQVVPLTAGQPAHPQSSPLPGWPGGAASPGGAPRGQRATSCADAAPRLIGKADHVWANTLSEEVASRNGNSQGDGESTFLARFRREISAIQPGTLTHTDQTVPTLPVLPRSVM